MTHTNLPVLDPLHHPHPCHHELGWIAESAEKFLSRPPTWSTTNKYNIKRLIKSSTYQTLSSWIYWAQTKIRSQYFPNNFRLKPSVRLRATNFDVSSRLGDFQRPEGLPMGLEHFIAKACSNFTDRLIFLRVGIVACQKERAIDVCALALSVIRSYDNQIQGIAYAG